MGRDRDILVDGYNVIKKNLMFQALEVKSLAEARNLLVRQLKHRYSLSMHRVIVVFDGNGVREQISHEDHVRIIFSRHGETADSVIKRLTKEALAAGRGVEMYSDDEEVRNCVAEQGGSIQSTRQLTKQLNAAPSDVALRAQHRLAMRQIYGIDPMYKAEDNHPTTNPGKRGKKKQKPPHRYKNKR